MTPQEFMQQELEQKLRRYFFLMRKDHDIDSFGAYLLAVGLLAIVYREEMFKELTSPIRGGNKA